jgi:glycosyltransferase involved in cell wall biosynthesis
MIVFREADPTTGGLGIDVSDVARGMVARGRRVEVMSMHPRGAAKPDLGPGVVVHGLEPWLRARPGVAFGLAPGAGPMVRRRRPRVLHLYSCLPVHMHWAAAAAAWRSGVPVVWTPMIHPGRRELWRTRGLAGRAMSIWDLVAPRAARLSDAVCAATSAEAEMFRRLGARRVRLVPPAVHPVAPASDREAAAFRARFGLDDAPLVLCVAGRPDHRKGLDYAAAVLASLRTRIPRAVLGAVGLVDDVPLAGIDGVRALGRLSETDLRRAYRAADVVFVPSRYEAFSRVVIEAWQAERPVVVTDRVALAEEVRRGGGAVVAFGQISQAVAALEHYLCDYAEAARAGAEGAELVCRRFLVGPVLDELEALYAEVAR